MPKIYHLQSVELIVDSHKNTGLVLSTSLHFISSPIRCAVDDTVVFFPSPTGYYRFGLEAFEFVNETFVFLHCHMVICNASDTQSKCARGCEKKSRLRREVGHHKVYSLAQGPLILDYNNEYQEKDDNPLRKEMDAEGKLWY